MNHTIIGIFSTLKKLQADGRHREDENQHRIAQLQQQLSQTTIRLDDINTSYEELRNRGDIKLDELKLELENRQHDCKERALKEHEELTKSFDLKRQTMEENCDKQIRRYENKINELERSRDENIQKRVRFRHL